MAKLTVKGSVDTINAIKLYKCDNKRYSPIQLEINNQVYTISIRRVKLIIPSVCIIHLFPSVCIIHAT